MAISLGLLLLVLLLAGCNGPGQPKFRAGALPFYGLGLHAVADPARLGGHRYSSPIPALDGEVSRGVIYTQQAGFVDVGHIRDAADWARYFARHARQAIAEGQTALSVPALDRSRLHLSFNYPVGWDELPEGERQRLTDDLALRCGQEAAYVIVTWHELITWYDYGTLPFISEKPSAFTYDDIVSHVIGLYVAERAWRDGGDYNEAVAVALADILQELGAGSPAETRRAIDAVRGSWWKRNKAIKRHLDVGIEDGEVEPMRIAGFTVAGVEPAESPGAFPLPRVSHVRHEGLDFSDFFGMELESRLWMYGRIRDRLPWRPNRIVPERDLPVLMARVRQEMREAIGPNVDTVEDGRPSEPPGFEEARTASGAIDPD